MNWIQNILILIKQGNNITGNPLFSICLVNLRQERKTKRGRKWLAKKRCWNTICGDGNLGPNCGIRLGPIRFKIERNGTRPDSIRAWIKSGLGLSFDLPQLDLHGSGHGLVRNGPWQATVEVDKPMGQGYWCLDLLSTQWIQPSPTPSLGIWIILLSLQQLILTQRLLVGLSLGNINLPVRRRQMQIKLFHIFIFVLLITFSFSN